MKKVIFLFLLLGFAYAVYSQSSYTNITISSSNSPEEPTICINPKNLNRVVAGANISAAYYSTNSGYNWTAFNLTNSSWGVWGDPYIIVDTNENFYYFHLAQGSPQGSWIDRIICRKSTNGGANYSNPGTFCYFQSGKQQDKESACVDPRNNYIYVAWTQFDYYGVLTATDSSRILFSKSTDGGLTWVNWDTATAKRIDNLGGDCYDEDNTVEGAVPTVGPNGEVYVCWAGPLVRNSQFGVFFNKSTDGGNTWLSSAQYIAPFPGGWDYMISGIQRANGLPYTCCDISTGPYRGNIYVNWTDSAGVNNHDVKFIRSTNGGVNWSAPMKVNSDATNKEQFFSSMTVDQKTGYIYILYYDRRDDISNAGATSVYISKSTDGGATFTDERISASTFIPTSSVFFGDYTFISAYNNVVRPIWTRLQGTSLSVLTAIIGVPTGVDQPVTVIPENYKLEQNVPNPFNPSTHIAYSIPKDNFVTLKVYNMIGQEVAVLVNEFMKAGEHTFDFYGGNLPSGAYFYKLTAGDFSATKKMILAK
ncbi:MAG: T9SS type A sorting domain-containing protein [Bacteroidetes bacterium]|nr:T9SS type A sorting domain-containing protein [Bacteroidota bacterium]